MKALRGRLQATTTDEAGLGMAEVLVAMMVFAIIMVSVAYTLLSSFTFTNDSRSRVIASNLASQEIDLVRSTSNLMNLLTVAPRTQLVSGVPFTVTRTVSWVSNTGTDVNCGSDTGSLQYKRVHVEVSWPKMVGSPIAIDTLLAPTSKINTDSQGTILVSAKTSTGAPDPGVAISVSPNPGSAAPVTDAQGCSYIFKVPPASYTVTASQTGYLDPNQNPAPSQTMTVVAGASSSAGFTFGQQATATITYASNNTALTPTIPGNLNASFISTANTWVTPSTAPGLVNLFPSTTYTVEAGAFLSAADVSGGCVSPDPGSWLPGTNAAGKTIQSPAPVPLSLNPGQLGSVGIPMGVVTIKNTAGFTASANIVATTTTPVSGSGDPGCSKAMSYKFTTAMPKAKNSTLTVALPYGTWAFKMDTNATPTTTVTAAQLSIPTGVTTGTAISAGGTVTLDPRVVVP